MEKTIEIPEGYEAKIDGNKVIIELKESEDERIRKEIIDYLSTADDKELIPYESWIAWLEKQGEQKPFNDTQEYLKGVNRVQGYEELTKYEKGFDRIADTYAHNKNKEGYNQPWYTKERAAEMLHWAKEELGLLEKQDEQNLANSAKTCKDEHNPAYKIKISWSDEVITDTEIEKVCNLQPGTIASLFASSQKQDCLKWSEEDNVRFTSTIQVLEFAHSLDSYNQYGKKDIRDNLTWLKSLKERYTWKPSDWQMKALADVISSRDIKYDILSELWKDLKKLKG